MDRYTKATVVASDSPPSEAWLFAQAILGRPIRPVIRPEIKAKAHRAKLERRAHFSSRHVQELHDLQATQRDARHDRALLEWDAQVSTEAQEKLLATQQIEAQERRAWHAIQRFTEADLLVEEWNEADHPRAPKRTPIGGQWIEKGGGGGGTSTGTGRPASSKEPRDNGPEEPNPDMLGLAHTWWQTKGALEQARRDIEALPRRIASERAQLGSGGRYAYIHSQNLAKARRNLEAAKALAPELEKQLGDLQQQYRDSGYDEIPYWAFTPAETIVGGVGIEEVGRAVARRGTPVGLQSTGIEFEIASALLAGPAVLRLGKAILRRAAASARRKVAIEAATLKPYRGAGGGHHIPAKSAFKGAAGYNAKAALAIPRNELSRLGVVHNTVTGAQQTLYREFAKTGANLTWKEVERIEIAALVRGGLNSDVARATVKQAIDSLKNAGVPSPTRIPWGN